MASGPACDHRQQRCTVRERGHTGERGALLRPVLFRRLRVAPQHLHWADAL